jgi:hypothetical protein
MEPIELRPTDVIPVERAEQQPTPIDQDLRQVLVQEGKTIQDDGFVVSQPFFQAIPKSRKLSRDPNQYSLNSTDNQAWHLLSTAQRTDPFSSVAVSGTSTAFIIDQTFSIAASGEGVDFVCMDGTVSMAKPGHPEWISAKTGLSRFQEINWPIVTGTTGTYTQPANYYTTRITNPHGTGTMALAAGRLYGFAKEAALYSIGAHSEAGLWTMAQGIELVRLFHVGKVDKSRPTVFMVNLGIGVALTNPNGASVSAEIADQAVTLDLSTSGGRTNAQRDYNVPIFTGTETYLNADNADVRSALQAAIAAGVIVVHSAGNWNQRAVPSNHPNYNDYFVNSATNIYFNRSVTSSVTDAISVGAYDSGYVNGKERLASFTTRGPLVDVFAPGAATPTATNDSSGTGTVLYPGSTTSYTQVFGGTSAAGPIAAGVVVCIAQLRPWMTSLDAKAAIREFAVMDRLHTPVTATLNEMLAFVGANNATLHIPFSHTD